MEKKFIRMLYSDGLSLKGEDYNLDKQHHRRLQHLHNRYLHTWGIAEGLEVKPVTESSMEVFVTEGAALDLVTMTDDETGTSESLSREILIYDGHPDNPVDLSEYSAGENIYITISYQEISADRDNEKGQGEEIHVWERCRISHDKERPQDCKENIILARIKPREPTDEECKIRQDIDAIIDSTCIFDTDIDGSPLRVYSGPYANTLGLNKFIFRLEQEIEEMPYLKFSEEIVFEVNSPSAKFTNSVEVKGDMKLDGELIWKSPNNESSEFEVAGAVLQVNSYCEGKWKARDGGLEVYRGGPSVAPDARIIWSEKDRVWKAGIGNDLNNIAAGQEWERLKNEDTCDDLHKHQGLYSRKGCALHFDAEGVLAVNADVSINDFEFKWVNNGNSGGIGWFGDSKDFGNTQGDGSVLYGFSEGLLGVTSNGQKPVLSWSLLGNVGIGSVYPKADMLDIKESIRLLGRSNPIRFTSKWTGFPNATINHAEISNDTENYKSLMIVGNQSAGQGRKVAIWDRLDVNGYLYVNGNMKISQAVTPSAGSTNYGIIFPSDPGGGSGDGAWMKYYPRAGESCTFEIGTKNDRDDNIAFISSGNIGIGTDKPNEKLDVIGWTRIMGSTNPIRFTSNWSGFPDTAANRAEISNDTGNYETLMIVGNKSGGQGRKVSIWDRLDVSGSLEVKGSFRVAGAMVPSAGNSESKGIMFPKNPYGGSGDAAWIRYYCDPHRGGGENMTLEIGIANDNNYELVEEKYWQGWCRWCSTPNSFLNRWGCGRWVYVKRWIRGITGDRLRLHASGGVYIDGGLYYSSSSEYKENITKICENTIEDALDSLEPVEFNFKGDRSRSTIGFIAEDVPEVFSAYDKKAINPMEIITVLVSEVKQQEHALNQLQKQITTIKNKRKK